MHHHRAEHWIVVSGTAEVTNGDKVLMLSENQSTYIPLGTVHRLVNPGTIPLEIIEVQSGSYLGKTTSCASRTTTVARRDEPDAPLRGLKVRRCKEKSHPGVAF